MEERCTTRISLSRKHGAYEIHTGEPAMGISCGFCQVFYSVVKGTSSGLFFSLSVFVLSLIRLFDDR